MSITGYRPPYLSEAELKKLVLEAVTGSGAAETFHALYGHLERGISTDDVIHGLKREWTYERQPEFNREFWQWKYRIKTETIDGDELTIIIAVNTVERKFEVVTRWTRET